MLPNLKFYPIATVVQVLAVGGLTASVCHPGKLTLSLNTHDNGEYGSTHAGKSIPTGYRGLDWINFFDNPDGPQAPTGTYSFSQSSEYSAAFYVNTTTSGIASLTLESFAAACLYTDTSFLEPEACQITVSAIYNSSPQSGTSMMINTQIFNVPEKVTTPSAFTTLNARNNFTGTHFYFYITGGFPGSIMFLDNINLNKTCK